MRILVVFCLVACVVCEDYRTSLLMKKKTLIKRIINGKAANIKDFPWQASLRTPISSCGAVVISSKTALTAAHCIKPNLVHALKVGSSFYHGGGGKTFKVTSIITHPEYDSRPTRNDIAILKFNEPIIGKALAKAIAIPEDDSDFSGQSCNITGWGQIKKHGELQPTNELQMASTVVLSHEDCKKRWRKVSTKEVCVYTRRNGACFGDSGGPLTCNNQLVGITSWGSYRCSVNYPSVYTRITSYRDWIKKNMDSP